MKIVQKVVLGVCAVLAVGTFTVNAFAVDSVSPEKKELSALLESNRNLIGAFQQITYDEEGDKQQESEGTFTLAQPNRFVWDTKTPFPQRIISDGEIITIWDIDLEQATQKPFKKALGNSPAALLSQPADKVLPHYTVIQLDAKEFALTPINNDGLFASLTLGFNKKTIATMRIEDTLGQVTVIDFKELKHHDGVDESQFKLVLPADVDLLVEGK